MDDPEKEHTIRKQPTKEALIRVKVTIMKWKRDIEARLSRDGRVWWSH